MLLHNCKRTILWYTFYFVLFIITPVCAQQSNLLFTHYTTREGLSNNIITALFQDSRGLLWIGTSNGLNFYDGVSFQNIFPSDFADDLHSDLINKIFESADGNILFITGDGIDEYNWKLKKIRLVLPQPKEGGFNQCIVDRNKNIWLVDENDLKQYNQSFKLLDDIIIDTTQTVFNKDRNSGGTIFCIDNNDNIWFSFHNNVYQWNVNKHILESKFNNVNRRKIFDIKAGAITSDLNGNYWVSCNELYRYRFSSDSLSAYHFGDNDELGVSIITGSGKMFVNSNYKGLYIFDTVAKKFQIIKHNLSNSNSPSDNIFRQLYEDNDGHIWMATNYGLDKCTQLTNSFVILDNFGYEDTTGTSNKTVINNITVYKKDLFVSTSAGLYKINPADLSQQHFRYDKYNHDPRDDYWLSTLINDSSMLAASWRGFVVYKVNGTKLHPNPFPFRHPSLMDSVPIVSAFHDYHGNIWFGMIAGNGIFRWNKNNNTYIKYDPQQTGKYGTPLRHFSDAEEDDDKNIWMGYDKGGLAIFDPFLQKFIQPASDAFCQLNENEIHDIFNDHHGNLWLSTSLGLYRYSPGTSQIKLYNRKDGLLSNIVTGVAVDKRGGVWLGSYSGLTKFDTSARQFTNFTTADGLPEEKVETLIYDSAINKICFITEHTVVLFDPYHLKKSAPVLSPIITSFYVMGKEKNLNDLTDIRLTYSDNFFSFNYTAPDLTSTTDIRYAYKLVGFNKDWVDAGKRQYVGYTNLNGGDYVFKLKVTIDGIHWFEMHVPVIIHIISPFYKTVAFYLLIVFTLTMVIFLIVYSTYRSQLKRMLLAQKIRNDIAADLHDDIGSSLSSIMIMTDLAKKRQEETGNYFDKIKENAGKVIENMNDIVWAVNPRNDTIEQMFSRMQSYASTLLEKKDIKFRFFAEDSLLSLKLTMEERKNFFLIFKEAIHNAFKYSFCSEVTVEINRHGKTMLMTVNDDGKGFDAVKPHSGNGLNNMKKRAGQIKGSIEIISSFNEGTCMTLAFKPTQKGSLI